MYARLVLCPHLATELQSTTGNCTRPNQAELNHEEVVMYNGIGLLTPRGSGTSGYVQRNRGYVPSQKVRTETGLVSGKGGPNDVIKKAVLAKANQEILEHKRKRQIEAKVYERREEMSSQGFTEEEIEVATKALRERLQRESGMLVKSSDSDTHLVAVRKEEEMKKLQEAFGIARDHVEGESWDPAAQEKRKREREAARADRARQREERETEDKRRREEYERRRSEKEEERRSRVKTAVERAPTREGQRAEEDRAPKRQRRDEEEEEDDHWKPDESPQRVQEVIRKDKRKEGARRDDDGDRVTSASIKHLPRGGPAKNDGEDRERDASTKEIVREGIARGEGEDRRNSRDTAQPQKGKTERAVQSKETKRSTSVSSSSSSSRSSSSSSSSSSGSDSE